MSAASVAAPEVVAEWSSRPDPVRLRRFIQLLMATDLPASGVELPAGDEAVNIVAVHAGRGVLAARGMRGTSFAGCGTVVLRGSGRVHKGNRFAVRGLRNDA